MAEINRGTETRFYHPELDGLRFFAFLAVFVHHALPADPANYERMGISVGVARWLTSAIAAGGAGVDFFFCLSAFLITELLLREHERFGSVNVRSFWVRRCLRIWPLYYAFVMTAAFVLPSLIGIPDMLGRQTTSFLLFFANWECAIYGYPASVIAPLWSVAIEEQFYFIWPVVVRMLTPRRLWLAVAAMLGVAITTRMVLVHLQTSHPGIWCNTFARLDPIALGVALALITHGKRSDVPMAVRWTVGAASSVGIVATFWAVRFDGSPPSEHLVFAYLLVAVCCAALLFATLSSSETPKGLLSHRIAVYLGRISYGLYVMHVLGLWMAARLTMEFQGPARLVARVTIGFVATLVLAAASYRWLEKPFLRIKTRYSLVASRPE